MNKEDCAIGQRVKIKFQNIHNPRLGGLIGTIKELPLGYVVVEIDIPFLVGDIEPVEIEPEEEVKAK